MILKRMLIGVLIVLPLIGISAFAGSSSKKDKVSAGTKACLDCHKSISPGIVGDWEKSRHAGHTPGEALKKGKLERRVSSEKVPAGLSASVVGCAECHTLNAEKHKDSFEHNGYTIHSVVTPADCAVCHGTEFEQFGQNIMSRAYGNLKANPLFSGLTDEINGLKGYRKGKIVHARPDLLTQYDSCYHCHGTLVEVKGKQTRETSIGDHGIPYPFRLAQPGGRKGQS